MDKGNNSNMKVMLSIDIEKYLLHDSDLQLFKEIECNRCKKIPEKTEYVKICKNKDCPRYESKVVDCLCKK